MRKRKYSKREIEVIIKKIASIENIGFPDTVKDYKYYFGKYNVSISDADMVNFKKKSLKSIRKPFSMDNK
jgi:hypothetical protein